VEPLVVAVPVPDGIDCQDGIGHKSGLSQHCPKEKFQERWNRTFWESLSQKCDSIKQGFGDMAVSLVVHSPRFRPSGQVFICADSTFFKEQVHSRKSKVKLMKSFAVLTLLPVFCSFIRKSSAAFFPSCSEPFLINFAPFKFSTEDSKNSIFFCSIVSWALTAAENSAKTASAMTNMCFKFSSINCRNDVSKRPPFQRID